MRMFLIKHPIIGLIMFGMICGTVVETADILANGKKSTLPFRKNNAQEEIKSVGE